MGKKWEYKNVVIDYIGLPTYEEAGLKVLNKFGSEGWEVCGTFVNKSGTGGCVLMKRELSVDIKQQPE